MYNCPSMHHTSPLSFRRMDIYALFCAQMWMKNNANREQQQHTGTDLCIIINNQHNKVFSSSSIMNPRKSIKDIRGPHRKPPGATDNHQIAEEEVPIACCVFKWMLVVMTEVDDEGVLIAMIMMMGNECITLLPCHDNVTIQRIGRSLQ